MPRSAKITVNAQVHDTGGFVPQFILPKTFGCAAALPQSEYVSCTGSAFTALSPPTGAVAVLIEPDTNASLTLKGVTGDTGIAITPSSNVIGIPLLIPLGSSPSIGIYNGGSTCSIRVTWF